MLKEFESVSPLLKKNQPVDFMSLEYLDEFTGTTNRNFSFRGKKIKKMTRKKIIVLKYNFSESYSTAINEIGKNLE